MMTTMTGERLFTVDEVAAYLRVSAETVRRWLRDGRMHGHLLTLQSGWRIPESELTRVLREGTGRRPSDAAQPPPPPPPEAASAAQVSDAVRAALDALLAQYPDTDRDALRRGARRALDDEGGDADAHL
jgi:excisionase family DNA binding protein